MLLKMIKERRGTFKGYEKKIVKNSQGIYKIQIKKYGDTWVDIIHNDVAMAIVFTGNVNPIYFFKKKDLDEFIEKHWFGENIYIGDEPSLESRIEHDFEEIKDV